MIFKVLINIVLFVILQVPKNATLIKIVIATSTYVSEIFVLIFIDLRQGYKIT